jgi:hypothetical protein
MKTYMLLPVDAPDFAEVARASNSKGRKCQNCTYKASPQGKRIELGGHGKSQASPIKFFRLRESSALI